MPQNTQSSPIEAALYQTGDYIFFEGDVENHFYIINSGTVSIFTKDNQGARIVIAELSEGESFGEFALISQSPRSASAQAKTDVSLVKVSEGGFQELLSELPSWAECMLKSFTDRLQNMTEKIRELEQQKKTQI